VSSMKARVEAVKAYAEGYDMPFGDMPMKREEVLFLADYCERLREALLDTVEELEEVANQFLPPGEHLGGWADRMRDSTRLVSSKARALLAEKEA